MERDTLSPCLCEWCIATSPERSPTWTWPLLGHEPPPTTGVSYSLHTNSSHPLIQLHLITMSLSEEWKVEMRLPLHNWTFFVNWGNKFEILEEKALVVHALYMVKRFQLVWCVGLCTETWTELRPEPTSTNYAFSDLNTLNRELNSFPLQTTLPSHNLHFPHHFL